MKLGRFIYILIPFFLYACAQIVPLSGGEKDVESPKVLKSTPLHGVTNFSTSAIVIEFNEFIKLQNLANQLIVSPLMPSTPEITVKGKKLLIKLPKSLSPNTTYSINFGNAIRDITENNAVPNFKYVFSTGQYLDTISYSGRVVDAFSLTEKEKVLVLLYDQYEDSIPLKERPRYLAITNKKGGFSITHIAKGAYKCFALVDINGNYIYDLPNEQIAFKKDIINIDSSSADNLVYLFKEDNEIQYVKKAENTIYGKIDFEMNLPTQNLFVVPQLANEKQWFLEEKNKAGDSLTHWVNDWSELKNITQIEYTVIDRDDIIDTVKIDLISPEKFTDTTLSLTTNLSASFDLNKNIQLVAERPVVNVLKDSIRLYEDANLVPFKIRRIDKISRSFSIDYNFKENTAYQLYIPPYVFTDIYGLKNDTLSYPFKTKKATDYGTLFLSIEPNFSSHYIIQLFKGKHLINEQFFEGAEKITYGYIAPGDYQLKLIIDENSNKKWDTGNYLENRQPEKVILYSKPIKIRANWDNEITWQLAQ